MKKNLLTFLMLTCLFNIGYSQNIHIIDLSALTAVYADETDLTNDSLDLIVSFKLKEFDLATQVNFMFGTTQNEGNILNVTGNIVFENDSYYLNYANQTNKIENYTTTCIIRLSNQQYDDYQILTLVAAGQDGEQSNILYWNK
ncbi:MAG TPA: hypothetical protein DDX39_12585 [Bacteroidales bacterium]|nr:MAG: hypothetical protein A2W98_05410 [Bacteroidetes bacterium GWF2_33_38]OFY74756.1 MAG: hypothetical protein A2265_09275 [Bacteroidetes bacterium RIFOXYA12_FULL_33_9]HBF89469.1 hypothetical protein [Bacteroidales bacterium]